MRGEGRLGQKNRVHNHTCGGRWIATLPSTEDGSNPQLQHRLGFSATPLLAVMGVVAWMLGHVTRRGVIDTANGVLYVVGASGLIHALGLDGDDALTFRHQGRDHRLRPYLRLGNNGICG